MKGGENLCVWLNDNWPHWLFNAESLMPLLVQVHQALGHLMERMRDQGLDPQDQAKLAALTDDVLKPSEFDAEYLDPDTLPSEIH